VCEAGPILSSLVQLLAVVRDRDRIGDVCISDDHISDAGVRLGDRDRIGDVWRWLAATPMAMTT
jgi:hypothetical protein